MTDGDDVRSRDGLDQERPGELVRREGHEVGRMAPVVSGEATLERRRVSRLAFPWAMQGEI